MRKHAARWGVGVALVIATATGIVLVREQGSAPVVAAPAPPAAPSGTLDADSALREAALKRFERGTTGVRMADGTRIAPRDAEHEAHIKVNLFKKVLARERAAKDPEFPRAAARALRSKRPAEIIAAWDDATGEQWVRFVAAATADCAFPPEETFQVEAGGLLKHPCLLSGSLKTRWGGTNPILRIEVLPLDENGKEWQRLVEEEMKSLAALDFLRAQGHTLAVLPAAGERE
ncbi:hypothetical protein ACLEPN_19940 [Myxococcus sp. 1LA]